MRKRTDEMKAPHRPVRSTWRPEHLLMRGPLTDRKIEQYRAAGWYSSELREARRELQAKREAKRQRREGNFLVGADGRLIFCP
jgi:hypothetical protein